MKFDPEAYTITIRKEEIDDEILYVGRVAEFPNISVYEEDFETTRNLVIDAIQSQLKAFHAQGSRRRPARRT